jgi:hypothetical protein
MHSCSLLTTYLSFFILFLRYFFIRQFKTELTDPSNRQSAQTEPAKTELLKRIGLGLIIATAGRDEWYFWAQTRPTQPITHPILWFFWVWCFLV